MQFEVLKGHSGSPITHFAHYSHTHNEISHPALKDISVQSPPTSLTRTKARRGAVMGLDFNCLGVDEAVGVKFEVERLPIRNVSPISFRNSKIQPA